MVLQSSFPALLFHCFDSPPLVLLLLCVAFWIQGRLLPTPELIPFRLTRDMVAGMGVCGVNGIFRRCGESTMRVLRKSADALLVVVEVFIHDPLYQWTLSPDKQMMLQGDNGSQQTVAVSGYGTLFWPLAS